MASDALLDDAPKRSGRDEEEDVFEETATLAGGAIPREAADSPDDGDARPAQSAAGHGVHKDDTLAYGEVALPTPHDSRAPARDVLPPRLMASGAGGWLARAAILSFAALAMLFVLRGRLSAPNAARPSVPAAQAPVAQAAAGPSAPVASIVLSVTPGEPAAPALDASAPELAHYEREEAKRALEAHKVVEALEIAQRAVEHDSSDAEGWLILGAAQLDQGDHASAQRAFKSCVDQARGGRRYECAALVR